MGVFISHDRADFDRSLEVGLSLAEQNAIAFFEVLGLPWEPHGEISMVEARRALMRGTSRDLARFERTEYQHAHGIVLGLEAHKIRAYLSMFEDLIHDAIASDARAIRWS